jgi:hypothetical protein
MSKLKSDLTLALENRAQRPNICNVVLSSLGHYIHNITISRIFMYHVYRNKMKNKYELQLSIKNLARRDDVM